MLAIGENVKEILSCTAIECRIDYDGDGFIVGSSYIRGISYNQEICN